MHHDARQHKIMIVFGRSIGHICYSTENHEIQAIAWMNR